MSEQPFTEKDYIPTHKATDGIGPIRSLCEPGWYQLAERWENVTCPACLASVPEDLRRTGSADASPGGGTPRADSLARPAREVTIPPGAQS